MMKHFLLTALLQLAFLGPTPNSAVPRGLIQYLCAFPTTLTHFFSFYDLYACGSLAISMFGWELNKNR